MEYNLNVNVKIDAPDLAEAYTKVGRVLSELKGLGEVTKVTVDEPKHSLPGHVPGCRAGVATRSGGQSTEPCTCPTSRR